MGQYIDFGCRLVLHPNVGLRWAQLNRQLDSAYSGTGGSITITDSFAALTEKSNFKGIGPIAGLDASYYLGMGFGAVGHVDSALLIGNINSSTNEILSNIQTVNGIVIGGGNATFYASTSNTRRVVPVVDGKLGLDYTYVFNNSANSDLTLEAGWMVSNYFNAVDRVLTNAALPAPSTFDVAGRSTAAVGLQGPYVSLVAHI